MITWRANVNVSAEDRRKLEVELGPLQMLAAVLRWAFAQAPALNVSEVVVQDEYTHDVVLPWREGACIVLGTT